MKTYLLRRAAGVVEEWDVTPVSLHQQLQLPLGERCHAVIPQYLCRAAAASYLADRMVSYSKKPPAWVSREAVARAAAKRINALGNPLPSVSL